MRMTIKVTSPDDVALLPWAGSYDDDAPLFELVDAYLADEPDSSKRDEAERMATLLGMGETIG